MIKKIVFLLLISGVLAACGDDNLAQNAEKKLVIEQQNSEQKNSEKQNSETTAADFSQLEQGDLIFQVSLSEQSKAIQAATNSRYSHVGILYKKPADAAWRVLEASSKVKLTPIEKFIAAGENQHFVVKRLKNASQYLTSANVEKMRQIGEKFVGKSYDLKFLWSDDKMYCSELVWKIYQRAIGLEIGKLQPLKNFELNAPAVQSKLKERYKGKVPLEELMISPGDMFNSDLLTTILEK